MKKSRFTKNQIVSILKESDAGAKVKEIGRRHGISDATFYNWKSRYGGMQASDLKRLKETEAELTHGSTWHAAGLLPVFNMSYCVGQLHKYSVDLNKTLEAETGQDVSFHVTGNLRLATNQERMDEYHSSLNLNSSSPSAPPPRTSKRHISPSLTGPQFIGQCQPRQGT
jgi:hypothetical protein